MDCDDGDGDIGVARTKLRDASKRVRHVKVGLSSLTSGQSTNAWTSLCRYMLYRLIAVDIIIHSLALLLHGS